MRCLALPPQQAHRPPPLAHPGSCPLESAPGSLPFASAGTTPLSPSAIAPSAATPRQKTRTLVTHRPASPWYEAPPPPPEQRGPPRRPEPCHSSMRRATTQDMPGGPLPTANRTQCRQGGSHPERACPTSCVSDVA